MKEESCALTIQRKIVSVVGPLESEPLPSVSQPPADVTAPVTPPVVQLTADVQRRLRRIVRTPGKISEQPGDRQDVH